MAAGIEIRLDFSLVLEENLGRGAGLSPVRREEAFRRAGGALDRTARRHASGEVGFPDLPFREKEAREIARFAAALRRRFTHLLVLGIGGSALGTKAVYEGVGGPSARRGMHLAVADNVDPDAFFPLLASFPIRKTAVVAISKSGTTAETNAQLAVAIEALEKAVGRKWRDHLVLITDPEKGIFRKMARDEGIASFPVPPNVGGRYSVLSPVGLLPLAAAGVAVGRLLDGARRMERIVRERRGERNPALFAAAVYGHYMADDPKPVHVWFTYGHGLDRVAEWWQQLWGESLGKRRADGTSVGQTPARAVGVTDQHSQVQLYQDGPGDKVYTFVRWARSRARGRIPKARFSPDMATLGGRPLRDLFDAEFEGTMGALAKAGRPLVRMEIGRRDEPHLGAFVHLWEWVTALVGESLGIDPFDQPGVEEGKRITRALMGERGSEERRARFLEERGSRTAAVVSTGGADPQEGPEGAREAP